ncbi:MAG TPA: hypothetical protein VHE55_02185 [Fimbriimonadaceae bacterium]|nr:hypothetical protein [Fimbriimonadaceae bacterium]
MSSILIARSNLLLFRRMGTGCLTNPVGECMLAVCVAAWMATALRPAVELDHIWIVVQPQAPERKILEQAGFHIAPTVNKHVGQGTASITIEFENAFLELLWPDPSVPVSPGLERATKKFTERMNWRTSGWCPFGIGMDRTEGSSDPLPVPTWKITADWLRPGTAIEMLTPRDDTKSPSLFVSPSYLAEADASQRKAAASDPKLADLYRQPIGVHRITGVRLVGPSSYQPIPALAFVEEAKVLSYESGKEWFLQITFDGGAKGKAKDFRPTLPLKVLY